MTTLDRSTLLLYFALLEEGKITQTEYDATVDRILATYKEG